MREQRGTSDYRVPDRLRSSARQNFGVRLLEGEILRQRRNRGHESLGSCHICQEVRANSKKTPVSAEQSTEEPVETEKTAVDFGCCARKLPQKGLKS
jgi:hypothetical protein